MISLFSVSAVLSLFSHTAYSSRLEGIRRFAFGVLMFSVAFSPLLSEAAQQLNPSVR